MPARGKLLELGISHRGLLIEISLAPPGRISTGSTANNLNGSTQQTLLAALNSGSDFTRLTGARAAAEIGADRRHTPASPMPVVRYTVLHAVLHARNWTFVIQRFSS
jgi:hypothetical protein